MKPLAVIVTNLPSGTSHTLYKDLYCCRGQAKNHIKSWKTHLAADRTSCHRGPANQLRLMLLTAAYWLMRSLRRLMPKYSFWREAQFDTLRLRLPKIAAQVAEWKSKLLIHLLSAFPNQAILRLMLERLPRLVIQTTGRCRPGQALPPQSQTSQYHSSNRRFAPGGEPARTQPSGERLKQNEDALGGVSNPG